MNYKTHIESALIFIEANLKLDIDFDEVVKAAGYSRYHFLRVFKEVMHLTPADYIRKRRISEIVKGMNNHDRAISDIAFEYGFNSKENFTRAFKTEHNILPTEYKSTLNSLKLYEKPQFTVDGFSIIPEIIELPSFSLIVYPCTEEHPPNFWNQYNCKKLSKRLSGGKVCEDFGVSIWNQEVQKLDYFIGIKKENVVDRANETVEITIPEGLFAVFLTPVANHFNFVNMIHRTWDYINTTWFPNSEYSRIDGCEFECYVEGSRIFREKIYIPITHK